MKAYGYARKKVSPQGLLEMKEVTFTGSPESIRQIAHFLIQAAEQMEKMGPQFSHAHIIETSPGWLEKWPDVIVAKSS